MSLDVPTPEEIARARYESDMTQSEVADKAGISQAMLSRIEHEDVDPKLSTVRQIADALP